MAHGQAVPSSTSHRNVRAGPGVVVDPLPPNEFVVLSLICAASTVIVTLPSWPRTTLADPFWLAVVTDGPSFWIFSWR